MRRLLAILLIAAFGLPAAAPALELGHTGEAHLPACCRRAGAHHCAGNMAPATNAPAISAVCPHIQQPSATAPTSTSAAIATPSTAPLFNTAALTPIERAQTSLRIARERSRHKRGPPADIL